MTDRVEAFLATLARMAGGEPWLRLPTSGERDALDAIAFSVNVLAQELTYKVEDLRQAKEAAEAANRAKTTFLANISHEIRTPLTAIIGFAELLQGYPADPSMNERYVTRIARNGQVLLRLIDDILDLSKFEAGHLALDKARFALRPFLMELVEGFEAEATAKGLKLKVTMRTSLPTEVTTDAARLRQILINVVGNALKFTSEGFVELVLGQDAPDRLSIAVVDSGVGIDPAHCAALFRPFSQGGPEISRRHGGSGLGLALSRRLARALDGDLELVRSTPGGGSEFRLVLPVGTQSEGATFDALT